MELDEQFLEACVDGYPAHLTWTSEDRPEMSDQLQTAAGKSAPSLLITPSTVH
eukprot:SAG22_NODE_13934_length_390_cov_1.061856_1_plen_53_part_00